MKNEQPKGGSKKLTSPIIKTMGMYGFKAQSSINKRLLWELMSGEYIDKKENVLLIGNPGTSKTH